MPIFQVQSFEEHTDSAKFQKKTTHKEGELLSPTNMVIDSSQLGFAIPKVSPKKAGSQKVREFSMARNPFHLNNIQGLEGHLMGIWASENPGKFHVLVKKNR